MGFYRGPNIVTDGLVLALDAGSERSYPESIYIRITFWTVKKG